MGYATTRSLERVAAAMGALESAPIRFEAAVDIPEGGVLLALPALLALGLLRHTNRLYQLPRGYYGIESVFLLLALMALARILSIEQLRYAAPGEWGNLLGLDRIPEVRCLRHKLQWLCAQPGRATEWNTRLAQDWMDAPPEQGMLFYADGHVRTYHGHQTALPRHYVSRQRLCLRATTDYWINAMDGQPFFYVNKEVDPGLLATLRQDLVPWLNAHAPTALPAPEARAGAALTPRFTLIFDREGYSPDFFAEMQAQGVAIVSYHKHAGPDWAEEEFQEREVRLVGGETVRLRLAEHQTVLSNGLAVREVRKQTESGQQVSILSTNPVLNSEGLAAAMFARWSQENFYRYMRQNYGLDRLAEYAVGPVPETVKVVNPARRKLDAEIRACTARQQRCAAQFVALGLEGPLEPDRVTRYQARKAECQERLEGFQQQLDKLKADRKQTPSHLAMKDLPEPDRFQRLLPERKHFIDTIKLICYRAETAMASTLREHLARADDGRSLLRQIFHTEVDLQPDGEANTLTVRLHHLSQNAHDEAIKNLCEELNESETVFPGTDLRLVYQIGST